MVNIWKKLTEEEAEEFRQHARDNFNPFTEPLNTTWHPVAQQECLKMVIEQFELLEV